jgi:hypothetical protein
LQAIRFEREAKVRDLEREGVVEQAVAGGDVTMDEPVGGDVLESSGRFGCPAQFDVRCRVLGSQVLEQGAGGAEFLGRVKGWMMY